MSSDSLDLEALFDSIADAQVPAAPVTPISSAISPRSQPATTSPTSYSAGEVNDSDELQALFDSMAVDGGDAGAESQDAADSSWPSQEKVFQRVGHMARKLHDTMSELGYDKLLTQSVEALPDAKDRLAYIANLTEQAACKVLNATDVANPLLESLETDASKLSARWDKVFANQLGVEEFKQLATETRAFLKVQLPQQTEGTKTQLMEIMMAQDFQDLTGQVIKKVVSLAQDLESQLMSALIEVMPGERRTESVNSLLNGPVIKAEGRADVVVDQKQVDDLLDSLGF